VNKNPPTSASSETLAHFLLCSLSLFTALSSLFSTAAPSDEQAKQWSNGAVAGVRAPQRVSAPPSSGLAAVPLWPEPEEQCPGSALSFPRAPA